jgi:hypothetical protein
MNNNEEDYIRLKHLTGLCDEEFEKWIPFFKLLDSEYDYAKKEINKKMLERRKRIIKKLLDE